jgi:hypothetical protein|tara:strand:- start:828 stop:1106 length:279 start_codon:yes stop_codon:yes gene_type:complete
MTKRLPSLVFLERQAYKRRRMRDLARAVPIIGAVLLSIPLLWTRAAPGGEGATTSQALVYVFAVWVFLIGLAALISRVVKSDALKQKPADPP